MKARISAMMCLLCVLGSADLTRAEDPYSQRVADPYALSPDPPTISSGTPELYMSFLTGYANTSSADATFTDGTQPTVVQDVDYRKNFSVGGNLGVWFPTRNKLAGFDLGMELTGFLWQADVACCKDFYNNNPPGGDPANGPINNGTGTEIQGLYIGPNFLVRYPLAISESYPNGRWFPYVGIGVGMHQMAMRPGGSRGVNSDIFGNGNPITDQRNTTVGFMGMGGIKAHLFKYVAAFAEAKYIHAHHDGLVTDRFGNSGFAAAGTPLVVNQYSSSINTILVHAGLSIHFDVKP
jgi:hypothetical protein